MVYMHERTLGWLQFIQTYIQKAVLDSECYFHKWISTLQQEVFYVL